MQRNNSEKQLKAVSLKNSREFRNKPAKIQKNKAQNSEKNPQETPKNEKIRPNFNGGKTALRSIFI